MLQGVLFYILFYLNFSLPTITSPVFTKPKNPNQIHHFLLHSNHLYEENPIPVFDPRPLYCSSLTTAVGGLRNINFVDSASPYRGTNQDPLSGTGGVQKTTLRRGRDYEGDRLCGLDITFVKGILYKRIVTKFF